MENAEEQKKKENGGTSLVVQWLGVHLPMRETRVPALARGLPHAKERLSPCATAAGPALWSPWAVAAEPAPGARAP